MKSITVPGSFVFDAERYAVMQKEIDWHAAMCRAGGHDKSVVIDGKTVCRGCGVDRPELKIMRVPCRLIPAPWFRRRIEDYEKTT